MKVMYFLHEGGEYFNGASRAILEIIRANAEMGNESYVVLRKTGGRLQTALEEIPNTTILAEPTFLWKNYRRKNPIRQLLVRMRFLLVQNIANHRAAHRLAEYAKANQIDLLHSNSSVISIGGLVQKYTGLPHVWHFREFGEEDFNLSPYVSQPVFYRFVEKHSAQIVCVSQAICKKVQSHLQSPEKAVTIYDGVTIGEKLPEKEMPQGCWKLLISGVISKMKGQWIAVEALQKLLQKEIHAELYIAGRGKTDELGPAYETVKEHVHLLGFVDDMVPLRREMNIELSCSVSEGFGLTTVEAMSAGNIIVGSRSGATPELIEDGRTGFLFQVNDAADLAEKLEKVMSLTTQEWNDMRSRAFDSVCAKFQKSICTESVMKLYQQLMMQKKGELFDTE